MHLKHHKSTQTAAQQSLVNDDVLGEFTGTLTVMRGNANALNDNLGCLETPTFDPIMLASENRSHY